MSRSWAGCRVLRLVGSVYLWSGLHSLESLALSWDHDRGGPHAHQVSGTEFWRRARLGVGGRRGGGCCAGLGCLGNRLAVSGRGLGEAGWVVAVLLEGGHSWDAGSLGPGGHVVHHGLSGWGPRARATGAGRGQRVGLHQFGLGSLCILPETNATSRLTKHIYFITVVFSIYYLYCKLYLNIGNVEDVIASQNCSTRNMLRSLCSTLLCRLGWRVWSVPDFIWCLLFFVLFHLLFAEHQPNY